MVIVEETSILGVFEGRGGYITFSVECIRPCRDVFFLGYWLLSLLYSLPGRLRDAAGYSFSLETPESNAFPPFDR